MKKSVYEVINKYLVKKGHSCDFSMNLIDYSNSNIYVRFDYVKKINAYKVVWVDFTCFDEKNVEPYINMQIVLDELGHRVIEILRKLKLEDKDYLNDRIKGDRVELINYVSKPDWTIVFDRFLPEELKELGEVLVILFAYLPRGMEPFFLEMLGKIEKHEGEYNYVKPVRFDLINDDPSILFDEDRIKLGNKLVKDKEVLFLEEVSDKYIGIVNDNGPKLVILHRIEDEYNVLWCNCKHKGYCEHSYAALMNLRKNKLSKFYKVRIKSNGPLLEKLEGGMFNLCFGVHNDKLMIVSNDGGIDNINILDKDGNINVEVLEDDDKLTLTDYIEKFKK